MAAHLKDQTHPPPQPTKARRGRRRETTISTNVSSASFPSPDPSLSAPTPRKEPPAVSPDDTWCCAPPHRRTATNTPSHPSQDQRHQEPETTTRPAPEASEVSSSVRQGFVPDRQSSSPFRVPVSPGRVSPLMDPSSSYPSSYSKFNSALNAGLLNPMSPPPSIDKTRSSPTLFEMMTSEPDCRSRNQPPSGSITVAAVAGGKLPPHVMTVQEKHLLMQERVNDILGSSSPGSRFNDAGSSDVKLTLSSKDGFSVSLNVHRHILVSHSRFFASKLSDRWSKQQKSLPHLVEISDCDDVEIYLETLRLMYCEDLKRRLMREDVSKVLEILKVSAAIVFEAGILACLEYLEAAPWAEDEEEKVAALLSQLQLDSTNAAGEVLKRVSLETPVSSEDEIVVRLLDVVLQGKDEKARREMKGLVSKMLRENSSHSSTNNTNLLDVSKESLYAACSSCLDLLFCNFTKATQVGFMDKSNHEERSAVVNEISRQADNLNWVLEILIDRQIAEDFTKMWASQVELAKLHAMVPTMYRFEVSRLTARLCVGIGKGQILAPKEVRILLLQTWLEPLYEDFGWMKRGCKSIDRNVVEEGLSQTILTLPLSQQQAILMNWFNRFLNSGDECPNIQRAFEVWWRRAFWKRNGETDRRRQLQIATMRVYENGG
ncbi:BTB/POZ domain-containing protein At1g63850 [Nymphaea colorata]|nr:BTB/POZ domain-containing protein At1g63850 [Nymphaea colorata]